LDTTGDVIFYDNKAKNAGIAIATVRLFNGIPSTNPVFSTDYVCPYFAPCEKNQKACPAHDGYSKEETCPAN